MEATKIKKLKPVKRVNELGETIKTYITIFSYENEVDDFVLVEKYILSRDPNHFYIGKGYPAKSVGEGETLIVLWGWRMGMRKSIWEMVNESFKDC